MLYQILYNLSSGFLLAFFLTTLIRAENQQKLSQKLSKVHKVPIRKISIKNTSKSLYYNNDLKYLDQSNVRFGVEKFGVKRSDSRKQYIEYFNWYFAEFTIGNPPQQFTLLLDMLSANLWVPDKSCDNTQKCDQMCDRKSSNCIFLCDEYCCGKHDKSCVCDSKRKFDSSKSKTYKRDGRDFRFLYFDNFADGFLGNDTLRFGGINNSDALTVNGIVFGQATTIGRMMNILVADGILGLAYRSIAVDDVEPPIMAAIRQGLLAKPMFTVFLKKSTSLSQGGGMLTYGGLDEENCGPVQGWAPLTNETYYQFEIQDISYGTKYRSQKKQQAVLDIGMYFNLGDRKIIENIAKYMGAEYFPPFDEYYVDCDAKIEPITLTINGKQYKLAKETFIVHLGMGNKCLFAMLPRELKPPGVSWILGGPFMRQFCTIHDVGNRRIGFAPHIQQ